MGARGDHRRGAGGREGLGRGQGGGGGSGGAGAGGDGEEVGEGQGGQREALDGVTIN